MCGNFNFSKNALIGLNICYIVSWSKNQWSALRFSFPTKLQFDSPNMYNLINNMSCITYKYCMVLSYSW